MTWMGHLVTWTEMATRRWEGVVASMAVDEVSAQQAKRWLTDASEHWQSLLTLAHTVRTYAPIFAEQWSVPLPPALQPVPHEEVNSSEMRQCLGGGVMRNVGVRRVGSSSAPVSR